jgi:radical SAM superfamily enzyme YgiQ (UPF0313 family)
MNVIPTAMVVLGGWHATAVPKRTMEECDEIDSLMKGEKEEIIADLVNVIENGGDYHEVKGILFRDSARINMENPDRLLIKNLDDLPYPARKQ